MGYPLGFEATAARASSFLIFLFPLFVLPSAGEVDKIVLPEDMKSVNFRGCTRHTGTAEAFG